MDRPFKLAVLRKILIEFPTSSRQICSKLPLERSQNHSNFNSDISYPGGKSAKRDLVAYIAVTHLNTRNAQNMESNAYASESSKDSDLLQQVPITKFGLTYLAIEELQSSQEKEEGCYSQHTGKELRAPIELGESLPDSIEVQDTEGNSIGIRQWCKGGNELELSGALYGIIFTVPSMSTRTHCGAST
ncbi:hypothetical protein FRC03_012519 [Tulasnella sp. 419]|nr:hypothetical protein FRC03_012519 [Tulasnella sp. 419]